MRLDGPNTISLLPGFPDQYCPRGRTCDVPDTSRLLHLPAYPTGWWKNAGGCERFPVMASEAFSTWSDEQLKSEKSLHWTGRCIVTAEIGSMRQCFVWGSLGMWRPRYERMYQRVCDFKDPESADGILTYTPLKDSSDAFQPFMC